MKHTTWGWVGVCALAVSALTPVVASACPKDGDAKKPSVLACPGDDKTPSPNPAPAPS
jgi:hypothetical protein